ncbi:unnamed protein product [Paramecium octaurelia]|uniref:Uncharacterized protein n=1 Tax=Paramecium octaurelia TaxID=43137 RepID=A0A8S1YRL3_PAROT|nr:unnamed protein product [Paramecium octaurelia]
MIDKNHHRPFNFLYCQFLIFDSYSVLIANFPKQNKRQKFSFSVKQNEKEQNQQKDQLQKLIQDNINMQKQYEKENKIKWEYNKNFNQSDQELEEALRKNGIRKKFNNITNHYNFHILLSMVIVKQLKVQNQWKKLVIIVIDIFVFVNKQSNYWENWFTFMVGIGFRAIIQKNSYQSCYNTGIYLINSAGYNYSHHNKDV